MGGVWETTTRRGLCPLLVRITHPPLSLANGHGWQCEAELAAVLNHSCCLKPSSICVGTGRRKCCTHARRPLSSTSNRISSAHRCSVHCIRQGPHHITEHNWQWTCTFMQTNQSPQAGCGSANAIAISGRHWSSRTQPLSRRLGLFSVRRSAFRLKFARRFHGRVDEIGVDGADDRANRKGEWCQIPTILLCAVRDL